MKRILFLMAFAVATITASAQTPTSSINLFVNSDTTATGPVSSVSSTVGTDTLYDANTIYTLYTRAGALNGHNANNIAITFNVTKISGTGTAKVFFQGSTDGKVWFNLNAGMLGTDGMNSDTLNIAAATTTPGVNYTYYSTNGIARLIASSSAAVNYVSRGRVFYIRAKIVCAGTQATIYKEGKVFLY